MRPDTEQHLVFLAIGKDRTGIVQEVAKAAHECRCNIADSRMAVMGQEFTMTLLISGHWDGIAKLEALLPSIAQRLGLTHITKRTDVKADAPAAMPYAVQVIALDNPGIVSDIAQFFASQDINIENMETSAYAAPHTGTPMFALDMTVNIPAQIHLASLRESFLLFCDDRNLDAVIEPYKHH